MRQADLSRTHARSKIKQVVYQGQISIVSQSRNHKQYSLDPKVQSQNLQTNGSLGRQKVT
jgi:hypothetical protein